MGESAQGLDKETRGRYDMRVLKVWILAKCLFSLTFSKEFATISYHRFLSFFLHISDLIFLSMPCLLLLW